MSREGTKSGVMVRVSAKRQARIGGVERLAARLRSAKSLILTEYRGLTVAEITELRRALRGGSVEYHVVKNSLTQRAADALGIRGLAPYFVGPTGVAFTSGDPVAAAKIPTAISERAL